MSIEVKIPGKKYRIVVPRYYDSEGKRVCHYETFKGTKKEAELREAQIKIEISNDTYVKKTKMTMGQLIEEWLEYKKDDTAPSTYKQYRIYSRNIIKCLRTYTTSKYKC